MLNFAFDDAADLANLVRRSEQELATADELDRLGKDRCVDFYYRATLRTAQAIPVSTPQPCPDAQLAWALYHRGLAGLLDAGQRYGRLNPRGQLTIREGTPRTIPINYYGFAWLPGDFCQLEPAAGSRSREFANHHATCGLGLSLVGVRVSPCAEESLFLPRQQFAVTAVLRPPSGAIDGEGGPLTAGDGALDFYNTRVYSSIAWHEGQVPICAI